MTTLRTRLGNDTLMNLAELRLHLLDEHTRKGVKARLKRHFGDRLNIPPLEAHTNTNESQNPVAAGSESGAGMFCVYTQ